MDVPERVHLMPVGYENDRIVLPAERLRADRVVLLQYADETDHPSYADVVRERLDAAGVTHETVPCDIFDLYDSIGTVAEVATEFADHDVFVNLASGSKVTAIGGMIACMATGATPYYVRAERYAAETDDDTAEGVREITELPTYPMDSPDRQQVAAMDYLATEGPTSKRDLIAHGEEAGLPFVADYDADSRKGKYRRLDSHVIDPLAEREYVALDPVGRTTRVSLTDRGADTLRAFRYLLST
ncbi:MAG: DUF6293 family protein [Haloarculaceae archaeon]